MSKLDNFKKAKWWEIALWTLGTATIGVVFGGTILSFFFGGTYFSGIVGGVLGMIAYYSYLFLKK